MIPRRRSGRSLAELVRVGPDAGQRGLEVVADAAQELVLGGVELQELGVLRLDLGEQLGVAHRDGDLVREQVQEVLVGALPATRGRQPAEEHAEHVAADAQDPLAAGAISPGTTSSIGIGRGSPSDDGRVDHPERDPGVVGGARRDDVDPVAWRDAFDRGEDPPELLVAPLEVGCEAVVALGQPGELVVAGDADRGRQVAGRDPIDRGRDRAQRRGQVGHEG